MEFKERIPEPEYDYGSKKAIEMAIRIAKAQEKRIKEGKLILI